MLSRKKIKAKLFIIISILLVIYILSLYFFKSNNNYKNSSETQLREIIRQADLISRSENNKGITYYVSIEGTSTEGTSINEPMSLEMANTKTYYGGDRVLFKRGETFYGVVKFDVDANENNMFYIGSYGDEKLEKPIISGAMVLQNLNAWEKEEDLLYKLDLTNEKNFTGLIDPSWDKYNVGTLQGENGVIYGNKKKDISSLNEENDFGVKDNWLYVKCQNNPIDEYGHIKITLRNDLIKITNNTILDGLIVENTGAHGIAGATFNVYIKNCVIQNIGGSYINDDGNRYGNGIEFWNASNNTVVENCIFRNIYDAGYTLQGDSVKSGFYNSICQNNIFINCTYPIEIFCHNSLNIDNCEFENNKVNNNIIINQGQGFGYETRPDKFQPANLVTWILPYPEAKFEYTNNKIYNSRALYYKGVNAAEDMYSKCIHSNNNLYYITDNTNYFLDVNKYQDLEYLHSQGLDLNSTFNHISDSEIEEISNPDILNSNNYEEIKAYYDNFDIKYRNSHWKEAVLTELETIINQEDYAEILQNTEIETSYEELKNAIDNLTKNVDTITVDNVSYSHECLYKFIGKIVDEYYNNKSLDIAENILIELIEELDKLSEQYKEIYSYYITEDNVEIETVKNKINDTIDKYNNNLDLDIASLESIITTSKNIYNNYITTDNIYENLLNKNRIIYITNIVDNIIDNKINKFVEDEKSKIRVEFNQDIDEPTNENITATLITGNNTTIINNGGSNTYTFYENGTFNFELEIKGVKFTVAITIANINKEYKIENGYISNISKNTLAETLSNELNISNYKITHNGKELNLSKEVISTGDILTYDNKEYTLIVSGDINKDGDCGIHDLVSFRKYLLEYSTYDNLEEMAADTNQDNSLDIKDLVGIRKIILN